MVLRFCFMSELQSVKIVKDSVRTQSHHLLPSFFIIHCRPVVARDSLGLSKSLLVLLLIPLFSLAKILYVFTSQMRIS